MRALTSCAILLCMGLLGVAVSASDDVVVVRAFEVHYRPAADAAELVGELLSEEGRLTLRPRMRVLIVEDRPAILKRVAALLEIWDLPPRSVEVTLSLPASIWVDPV